MYCVATINQKHHAKYTRHLQQLHLLKLVVQIKISQDQVIMVDNIQKLPAISARRQYIMQ